MFNDRVKHKKPLSIWPPHLVWTKGARPSRDCLESARGRPLRAQSHHPRRIRPTTLESCRSPRRLHRVLLNSPTEHLVYKMEARWAQRTGSTAGRTRFDRRSSSLFRLELGLIATAAHNKRALPQDVPSRFYRDPVSRLPPTLWFFAHSISDFKARQFLETPVGHFSVYIGTCHIILHRCARAGSLSMRVF